MSFIIGTGTFTNGSSVISNVSLTSGTLASFSSGTAVFVQGYDEPVEAIGASGSSNVTLRNNWLGSTGSFSLVAFDTIEGLRDAIQSARGFSQQLQEATDSFGTAATADATESATDATADRVLRAQDAYADDSRNYHNQNLNPSNFVSGGELKSVAYGHNVGSGLSVVFNSLSAFTPPTSITASGTFQLVGVSGTTIRDNIPSSDIALSSNSSARLARLVVSGSSGLTVGDPVELRSRTTDSYIVFNF